MPPPQGRPKQPSPRKPLPSPFSETTRAVGNEELINAVRSSARPPAGGSLFDEPTRLGDVDAELLMQTRPEESAPTGPDGEYPPKFLPATTELAPMHFDDLPDDVEATRMANVDGIARKYPPPPRSGGQSRGAGMPKTDERTRAVDIRTDPQVAGINDPGINDIDWDID